MTVKTTRIKLGEGFPRRAPNPWSRLTGLVVSGENVTIAGNRFSQMEEGIRSRLCPEFPKQIELR
jgi:hypothetical protein